MISRERARVCVCVHLVLNLPVTLLSLSHFTCRQLLSIDSRDRSRSAAAALESKSSASIFPSSSPKIYSSVTQVYITLSARVIYQTFKVRTLRAAANRRSLTLRDRRYYPSNRSKTTDSLPRCRVKVLSRLRE